MKIPEFYDVETSGGAVSAVAEISPELDWFKGHFDAIKIFPGVGQIRLVAELCRRHLGVDLNAAGVCFEAVKYMRPIVPGLVLRFSVTAARSGVVEFVIADAADPGKAYTRGKCTGAGL